MHTHVTVFRDEAIDALAIRPDSIIVDATLGSSGHARGICDALGKGGTFVGIDADGEAVARAREVLADARPQIHLCENNFRNINSVLDHLHIAHADGILADLGWRMEQFGGNGKGFSFQVDEPLIMTFGRSEDYPFTAHDVVNEWEEEHIKNVLKGYGEEPFSGRIARAIVEAREHGPIEGSVALAEIVRSAVPAFTRRGRIHPATRTFQALRIVVNDELGALETLVRDSISRLAPQGRLAIITFHSLEDRVVKHLFREYARDGAGTILTKKPIAPTRAALLENPRARSAKLRIFEHS